MTKVNKLAGSLAIAAVLCHPAFAADPPASEVAPAISPNPQLVAAQSALEKARELRKLADRGDAGATFEFGMLLAMYGPGSYSPDFEHAKDWKKLADGKNSSAWVNKAADAGHQPAIDLVCRLGVDPYAPAELREKGSARCQGLRRKFPENK